MPMLQRALIQAYDGRVSHAAPLKVVDGPLEQCFKTVGGDGLMCNDVEKYWVRQCFASGWHGSKVIAYL
jgi:hypothetical protein